MITNKKALSWIVVILAEIFGIWTLFVTWTRPVTQTMHYAFPHSSDQEITIFYTIISLALIVSAPFFRKMYWLLQTGEQSYYSQRDGVVRMGFYRCIYCGAVSFQQRICRNKHKSALMVYTTRRFRDIGQA
jgi:hypothetical protein